jgi:hypothetical protein
MPMLQRHWRERGVQNLNAPHAKVAAKAFGLKPHSRANGNFFISTTRDLL